MLSLILLSGAVGGLTVVGAYTLAKALIDRYRYER